MELYGHWNTGSVNLFSFSVISVLFVNCTDNYHLHFCDKIKLIRSSHVAQYRTTYDQNNGKFVTLLYQKVTMENIIL
jgi:hypothetical protein